MNRFDFQRLSDVRQREAETLLSAGEPAGAYYLMGYAVECALKACIARATQEFDFPEKERVNQSYSHDLTKLLQLAGLDAALRTASDNDLVRHWTVVKDWKETSRYTVTIDMETATDMCRAAIDPESGVLRWLRQNW